ncbi:MAG: RNA polymerase sigma factor [Paracoccaceae bacterium]
MKIATVIRNSRQINSWRAGRGGLDGRAGLLAERSCDQGSCMRGEHRDEVALLESLRSGDEAAFSALYTRHTPSMIRVAATIVNSRATAEEVAQETWIAVLKNIGGFEGRSSLAGWIFTILINKARTRARRDGRSVSFEEGGEGNDLAAAFDGHGRWKEMPELWDEITPERIVAGRRLAEHMREAIDALPPAQRAVIVLRVQQGLDASEVCEALGLSDGNMRVLLHRARLSLRARLAELS